MKSVHVKILVILLALVCLAGCGTTKVDSDYQIGTLVILIASPESLESVSCRVIAKDSSGEIVMDNMSDAGAELEISVSPGKYSVEYTADDRNGKVLASGTASVMVYAGRKGSINIVLQDPETNAAKVDVLLTTLDDGLPLKSFIKEVDSRRSSLVRGDDYISVFKDKYVKLEPEYSRSITKDEALALMERRERKDSVSYDEAVADVDLYFRLLRYRLGHYGYLGGDEVFFKARDAVFDKLTAFKGNNVSTSTLASILVSELGFIDDCHFGIDGHQVYYEYNTNSLKYVTYLSGLEFESDDDGYFFEDKTGKWYYSSCDNDNAMIVPMLNSKGELYYSLVLYCPPDSKPSRSVVSYVGPGDKKKTVTWDDTRYGDPNMRFGYKETENIAYVGLVSCGAEIENQLYDIARKARQKDVVIVDLRSNGGTHGYEFFKGYVDSPVSLNEVAMSRVGMTNNFDMQPGGEHVELMDVSGTGKVNDSKSITIVLVDNSTGCAPEEFSQYFRFINNCIVVGTNTMGHLDGGTTTWGACDWNKYDMVNLHLPNTGMEIQASTNLALYGDYESMVGKGFLPDIYVDDTSKALKYVLAMLNSEGLISNEAADYIAKEPDIPQIPLYTTESAIDVIKVESEFGSFYEARAVVTVDNPVMSFKWENPDTTQTFRIEQTSSASDDIHVEARLFYNGGNTYGSDFNGGNLLFTSPMSLSMPLYGTLAVISDKDFGSVEVAYRFVPIDSGDDRPLAANIGVKDNEIKLLEERVKEKSIRDVYDFRTGYSGSFDDWPDKPLL